MTNDETQMSKKQSKEGSRQGHDKVKFIKKDGFTVGHTSKQVSLETIKELLAE
jgi:hypothetical protein